MTMPSIGEFCWNELSTPDVAKAKDFYGKVFGWKFSDHPVGDMTYTMIKTQEKEFGGMWQIPNEQKDQIPPHWMAYILVADVTEALEKAQEHGATVKMPVTKAGEMGQFAVIMDPTGAHIAIWQSLGK